MKTNTLNIGQIYENYMMILHTIVFHSIVHRYALLVRCIQIIKGSCIAFIFLHLMYSPAHSLWGLPYSSQSSGRSDEKEIKTYFYRNLHNLTKALKPRMIHYISTNNYNQYNQIHVTGVLFTYRDPSAYQVSFVHSLDQFRPHLMTRNKKGVWYYILLPKSYLSNLPGKEVRYKFLVDGAFETDSNGLTKTNSSGGSISVYHLDESIFRPTYGPSIIKKGNSYTQEVIFRIKLKDVDQVSLIGNFNHWDNDIDVMQKISDNVFELRKKLPKGEYTYLFYSGSGYHVDDVHAEKKKHPIFGRVSYIKID